MKKILILMMLLFQHLSLYSEILISSYEGLVEFQRPGSVIWEKAEEGTVLSPDSRISTGFKSNALLLINNATKVKVMSFTRLKVEEVISRGNTGDQQTKLFMSIAVLILDSLRKMSCTISILQKR